MKNGCPRPNFFIIGAPRCGTTALSSYLAQHPDICFSIPKEPLFFCDDMPNMRYVDSEEKYLAACFAHGVGRQFTAVGEGSVWYLYSLTAIQNILSFNPDAKFIIIVRNPLEMLDSLHQKLFLFLDEDQPDFSVAWQLQSQRRAGMNIADTCREPKLLQYAQIGRLGSQVQRAFQQIPEKQRMLITFEDFSVDTRQTYLRVLSFLGVNDDGRTEFPQVNENQRVRNRYLLEKASNPPAWSLRIAQTLKGVFGFERLHLLPKIRKNLLISESRKALNEDLRNQMIDELSDDIELLATLIGSDLSHWTASDSSSS